MGWFELPRDIRLNIYRRSREQCREDKIRDLVQLAKTCRSCLINLDWLFPHPHQLTLEWMTEDDGVCSCLWIEHPSAGLKQFSTWSGRLVPHQKADVEWLQSVLNSITTMYER